MKQFAALYQQLDRSTGTLDKRAALIDYFRTAPAHDAAWALHLLCGGKIAGAKARIASGNELRDWTAQATGLEDWLVADSYAHVGDLAETLALLFDEPVQQAADIPLSAWSNNYWPAPINPLNYAGNGCSRPGTHCRSNNGWYSTNY